MKALLPERYLQKWGLVHLNKEHLQEIRLRIGKPIFLTYMGKEMLWGADDKIIVTKTELECVFEWLCGYGVYAYQEEMKKGYITIKGGHRIGIGGQVSISSENGTIGMKYISSILIRVSHDIKGISQNLMPKLYQNERALNVLILSPPGCGKTTLLRDMIRSFSNGNLEFSGKNVSVIDEREELSAAYMGVPTLDLGVRTDLILGCEKSVGMEMCLRALGPDIVAVDEIFSESDYAGIKRLKGCGCSILATHHATDYNDFCNKRFGQMLLEERIFDRYIVLTKQQGTYLVKDVINSEDIL